VKSRKGLALFKGARNRAVFGIDICHLSFYIAKKERVSMETQRKNPS
jgi:hypothetical protein